MPSVSIFKDSVVFYLVGTYIAVIATLATSTVLAFAVSSVLLFCLLRARKKRSENPSYPLVPPTTSAQFPRRGLPKAPTDDGISLELQQEGSPYTYVDEADIKNAGVDNCDKAYVRNAFVEECSQTYIGPSDKPIRISDSISIEA